MAKRITMENKVLFEGMIVNEVKLMDNGYGPSCFLVIKNTQTYKKKDGSIGESSCTLPATAERQLAQEIGNRFKKGDMVSVKGAMKLQKTKNLDQEGQPIYRANIKALKIDAMVQQQNLAPLPESLQATQATQQQNMSYQAIKQPTPIFKKQVNSGYNNQPQPKQQASFDEDPFGDRNGDPLPF